MKFVALLRGINVGGQKSVKMALLAELFRSMRFTSVDTYLQSGNVVFQALAANAQLLGQMIERTLLNKLGFEVKIILRTSDEIEQLIKANPLLRTAGEQQEKLHVTFLQVAPSDTVLARFVLQKAGDEAYDIKGKEVYLYCPNGYGKTKMSNQAIEKILKIPATTRNWNTVSALFAMCTASK
jgi:uncharacterized protein (DUF1697 family)